MGVPAFVVAEIHLHQADPRLDQLPSHQQRPPERVPPVPLLDFDRGGVDVKRLVHPAIGQQRQGRLPRAVELGQIPRSVELPALLVERLQQRQPGGKPAFEHFPRQFEPGGLVEIVGRNGRAVGALEPVFGKRPVDVLRVFEPTRFDEPRVELPAHLPGELPGNGPAGHMHQFFRQDRGGGEVVAGSDNSRDDRGERGMVVRSRLVAVKAGGKVGPPSEHHVVADRMLVVGVGQRPAESPEVAALGEAGQMLADRDAGGAGVDGGEFAANVFRGVGLGVEAVVLPKAAREEDVDDRPMATGRARVGSVCGQGAEAEQVVGPQAKQGRGSRNEGGATRPATGVSEPGHVSPRNA